MHGIIVICNRHLFSVIVLEELVSKVIDPKVIDNSLLLLLFLLLLTVCMLFQLLVIVNNMKRQVG